MRAPRSRTRDARRGRVRRARAALVVALLLATATGCTRIEDVMARVPVFAFMRQAPSFGPHENPRPAPPGAVPYEAALGEIFGPLDATEAALQGFAAGPHGQNPLDAGDLRALEVGRVMYDRHCAVCHGATGRGDGPVVGAGRFPFAPDLVEGPAVGQADGYVYALIRAGRGLMPAYGARISHLERWAIVSYMRALQVGGTAPTTAPGMPLPDAPAAAPADTPADTLSGEERT